MSLFGKRQSDDDKIEPGDWVACISPGALGIKLYEVVQVESINTEPSGDGNKGPWVCIKGVHPFMFNPLGGDGPIISGAHIKCFKKLPKDKKADTNIVFTTVKKEVNAG